MNLKKVFFGEKMPDKDDPKYKKRYEKEVEAGRKTARALKLDTLTYSFQGWAMKHSKAFFFGVLMLIAFIILVSLFRLATATKIPTSTTNAVEMQEKRLHETKKFKAYERQQRHRESKQLDFEAFRALDSE